MKTCMFSCFYVTSPNCISVEKGPSTVTKNSPDLPKDTSWSKFCKDLAILGPAQYLDTPLGYNIHFLANFTLRHVDVCI